MTKRWLICVPFLRPSDCTGAAGTAFRHWKSFTTTFGVGTEVRPQELILHIAMRNVDQGAQNVADFILLTTARLKHGLFTGTLELPQMAQSAIAMSVTFGNP